MILEWFYTGPAQGAGDIGTPRVAFFRGDISSFNNIGT